MVNQDRQMDLVFQALANPIRVSIVDRLCSGERTPGELAQPLPVSAPAVSRHLRILEEAGLIRRRKEGRTHRIALQPAPLARAGRWLVARTAQWEDVLEHLERHLAQKERDDAR